MLTRRFLREYSAQFLEKKQANRTRQVRKRQNAYKKEIRLAESTQTWYEFIIHDHKLNSNEMDAFSLNGELSMNVGFS